jgi:putative transposase
LAGNVISLYAKGMTTGDIQAHLAEIYGTDISRDTISRITDAVVEDMVVWQNRPLDRVYPVILIDAIVVKIRDGQVANRPIYVATGVNMDGERDVLGCWVGPTGGEGAKFWMGVLTELRNRGIQDTFIVCCDGLKGLPDSIRATWPLADVQLCVVHLVRSSLRYTSKKHWGQVCREMREIYTAPTVDAAQARFDEFAEQWRERYPVSWDEIPPEQVRAGMLARGMPEEIPDPMLGYLATCLAQPGPSTDTVSDLLGRPALTFTEWAAENAAAFRN